MPDSTPEEFSTPSPRSPRERNAPAREDPTTTGRRPPATPSSPRSNASEWKSTTITKWSPLKKALKLSDFSFEGTPFEPVAPTITGSSKVIDVTTFILQHILAGDRYDIAKDYLLDHKELVRLFQARTVQKNGAIVVANFRVSAGHQARAMVWHLFDRGTRAGACTTCESEQSMGPFSKCIVPTDEDATGACTNCWFMKRSATCSHRPSRPNTPTKKSDGLFDGFKAEDVREATNEHLGAWRSRIETELRHRAEEKKIVTTRGRKRAAQQE